MIYFKPLTDDYEWNWFKKRTSVLACEDTQGIVGVNEHGDVKAVSVFDTFTPSGCNVHMAMDSPMVLRRGLLHEMGRHLFIQCGLKRLWGLVPENNEKALRLNRRIGLVEVARVPDAIDDGIGYVIMRMNREECRWIPEKFREVA